jgi:LuxR family transcriptional regulator, maltose regulon positive regulatory protein
MGRRTPLRRGPPKAEGRFIAPTALLSGRPAAHIDEHVPSDGDLIARPALVATLDAAGDGCVVVLSAPAGYGKTTLLREWEAEARRPFAWVELDERDDDAELLEARVARARRSQRRGERCVLVVDDAHVLRSPDARLALERIAADLPAEVVLALATRGRSPLPLARLRAQHRLVELGAGRLAMTRSEIAALVTLGGGRPAAREIDALTALTEGWPAVLSLALLAPSLDAADPTLTEYVEDQVLATLDDEDRAFLRRASVLDVLSARACDAVLGRSGSAAVLARLARADVLLVPLDPRGERLRPHRLLGRVLARELDRVEPTLAPELHRSASAWHRRAGDVDGAVRHAVAGGDVAHAAGLVWSTAAMAVTRGDAAAVERNLERFSARQIRTIPDLALAAASTELLAGRGDVAAHWRAAAVRATPSEATPAVLAGLAALRAALGFEGLSRVVGDAERAAALLPHDGPCAALCRFAAGAAHHLLGDRDRATAELTTGARRAAVTAPALHALCLAQLGVLALERDDRDEAAELVTRARAQLERHRLDDAPACALVFAASAVVRAQAGRIDDARRDLAQATRLQSALVDFVPWYEAEVRILGVQAAWRLCDVPDALARLRGAERFARRVPEATVLSAWLEEVRDQLAAATAPTGLPPASLTPAELRILRFLPTHLSFREIAERTYVSANTVKSQANAVYRKFDVGSRSDAVTRARELGVLDPP